MLRPPIREIEAFLYSIFYNLSLHVECSHARIYGCCAQLLFDAEKLIVLCDTLGSGRCAGLDLAGVQCDCQICNRCILSLAGAVGRDRSIACRLSLDAYADKESTVTLSVTNNGNVDLTNLNLTSSAPTDWEVTFSESTIDTLEAGATKEITATIKPAQDVITGDYVTSISIKNDEASSSADLRVSVKTSTTWGIAAIAIIVVLVAVLGMIFKKFGRR